MSDQSPNNDSSFGKNVIGIFILIFIATIILPSYLSTFVNKNKNNCEKIKKYRSDIINSSIIYNKDYFQDNNDNPLKLKNFFVKTAYNCFCSGSFKNDYVNKCALENCKKHGARALDLQVFSLKGVPIVAANSLNTNLYKETFNHITLEDAIRDINNVYNLTVMDGETSGDPMFLILRIHYDSINDDNKGISSINKKKLLFYDKIYEILNKEFPKDYTSEFASTYNFNNHTSVSSNYSNINMVTNDDNTAQDATYKLFLFIILNNETSDSTDTDIVKKSKLNLIVDDYGNDANQFNYLRFGDVISYNKNTLRMSTKENLYYSIPNLGPNNYNYNFSDCTSRGIQFIGMNFQNNDYHFKNYIKFFKENSPNLSFVKIPSNDGLYGYDYNYYNV
tara:strand:+ start:4949 stop:6124 length:1176 start_codon:yes stop_codon:yes gene_type:complete